MILEKKQIRQAEQASGLSEEQLMEKAGCRCAELILDRYPQRSFLLLCGQGNNGGDGLVIARQLSGKGRSITVVLMQNEVRTAAALQALKQLPSCCQIQKLSELDEQQFASLLELADLLIDCVFGIGFHAPLPEALRPWFQLINRCRTPLVSIDINSGMEADSSGGDPDALNSDLTLALGALKPVHLFSREHGKMKQILEVGLGFSQMRPSSWVQLDVLQIIRMLPKLHENDYKSTTGRLGVIAGSQGMIGAAQFNLEAASALGCGMIHLISDPDLMLPLQISCPHVLFHSTSQTESELTALCGRWDAACAGSGCDRMAQIEKLLDFLLHQTSLPLTLDAFALRLLSQHPDWLCRPRLILTPHPGEFSALCGASVEDIQRNRLFFARQFATTHHVTLVLKGANTVVAGADGRIYVNQTGNPALAKAGSGDLLTGLIAALSARGLNDFEASCAGVWLQGTAADKAAETASLYTIRHREILQGLDHFLLSHQRELR